MELSIQKWGDSAAVRLPPALLEQLKVALGDKRAVDVRPEGVMLKPARHRYVLADLVAQCDPKAPMPADLAAWNVVEPVGREAW
jgi:antitoxin ChpS